MTYSNARSILLSIQLLVASDLSPITRMLLYIADDIVVIVLGAAARRHDSQSFPLEPTFRRLSTRPRPLLKRRREAGKDVGKHGRERID